ncbi:MAG: hypothetical protein M3040_16500 [Bacteroidota bacterium]|nr:hypothetical protein [Bacteroidota bacterium]
MRCKYEAGKENKCTFKRLKGQVRNIVEIGVSRHGAIDTPGITFTLSIWQK